MNLALLSFILEFQSNILNDFNGFYFKQDFYPILNQIHTCEVCGRTYSRKTSLYLHVKYCCGKEPKFCCPIDGCTYKGKLKQHVKQHLRNVHKLSEQQQQDIKIKDPE